MNEPRKVVIRRKDDQSKTISFTIKPEEVHLNGTQSVFDDYRSSALDVFNASILPSVREEAWRRTDISKLNPADFRLQDNTWVDDINEIPPDLLRPIAANQHAGQVIISGDSIQTSVDKQVMDQGVIFDDLSSVARDHPEIIQRICGKVVKPDEGIFAAAGSLANHGPVLYVPRGVNIESPLHSLIWAKGEQRLLLSHMIIHLEEGASVTLVHECASNAKPAQSIMHSGIVEIYLGNSADLRFVELQSWSHRVWNFTHERAVVSENGQLDWIFGAVGSRLTKNFSDLVLHGEGATGKMSGFYFSDDKQHFDHDTSQNHLTPRTTSDLLFKGALRDSSRSVWQGMIYVAPGADKTDGYQSNRNLVLSKEARADSIPGLEILADDVRCTHGATIGKIDPEPIFYLTSRGIPKPEAEKLLVEGFFDPIMQRIPFDGVRDRFFNAIKEKMRD